MLKRYTSRIITLTLLCAVALTTVAEQVMFTKWMTSDDGLSDNSVSCALRDKYGFLWLGTSSGLNCFDGNGMIVYRSFDLGIVDSQVSTLYEYGDDIWYGCSSGIYMYNRAANRLTTFPYKTQYGVSVSSYVSKITGAGNGYIWICTQGQGFFVFNPAEKSLYQDSRHGNFFTDMVTGNDGLVYLVSLRGEVSVFYPDGRFIYNCTMPGFVLDKNKISMSPLGGDMWICSGTQLFQLNIQERVIYERLGYLPSVVNSLLAKSANQLLMGTDNGIYIYNNVDGSVSSMQTVNQVRGLSDNIINSMYWDADSALIAMTQENGICILPWQSEAYRYVELPIGAGQRSLVRAICRAPNGRDIYVGTDKGLYFYDYTTKIVSAIVLGDGADDVTSLSVDGEKLWVGTRHHGIRVVDMASRHVTAYMYDTSRPYTVMSNDINEVYHSSRGETFVLTNWGLCQYDYATEGFMTFANLSQQMAFVTMCEDKTGQLWAATSANGLYLRTGIGKQFTPFYSKVLGTKPVYIIKCDSKGGLWVAVQGEGLCYLKQDAEDFMPVNAPLLNHQTVNFLQEDDNGYMWIGYKDGLLRSDVNHPDVNPQFYYYNHNDDFHLTIRSSCKSANGDILFGCGNGFYAFAPKQMKSFEGLIKVYIQSISFPNAEDWEEEVRKLKLDVPLYTRDSIELPFSNNTFTLHFSASRYSEMPKIHFNYMLKGVDKTWMADMQAPEVTYSNLPPGNYEFLIRFAGNYDASQITTLHIRILPPWYRTIWAYLIYLLLISSSIWYAIRRTRQVLRRRYDKQMQEFRTRQERETFQSKIRFFVDLVHEIRTPLTLMSLPLEQMADEGDQSADNQRHISSIRRNMNYLLGITNQLLDFQKAENNGGITLQVSEQDVCELIRTISMQFEDAIEVQGKSLQIQLPDHPVRTALDKDKVAKVLMNLMGNAEKYARKEVVVRLDEKDENTLCISVVDDGPGVPKEEKKRIFDMYYQIGNDNVAASLGTGLGLAYAKMLATAHHGDLIVEDAPGGGSLFALSLPITHTSVKEPEAMVEVSGIDDDVDKGKMDVGKQNFTILLVEDNEELLRMTAEALNKWYKVRRAHDGMEALDILAHREVDMIVSDVMMPRMDGTELCRRVKEDINYSHIPVILLTAKTSVEAKQEGMESGADVYIEKPFTIQQLYLQITNLLRMRQQFYERMRSIDGFAAPANDTSDTLGLNRQDLQFIEHLQKLVVENLRDEEFSIDFDCRTNEHEQE